MALFTVCVISGDDICLPIQMCRQGNNKPTLPIFIINQKLYVPIIGDAKFNATIVNSKICFKQVTGHIHYIQVCYESRPFCNNMDEIIVLLKTGQIEVTGETLIK